MKKIAFQNLNSSILFFLIFLIGYLAKYNFLAYQIYQFPSVGGLAAKNLVFFLVILIYLYPLIKFRQGMSSLLILYLVFTAFFLMNIWYNRYFGNYLSLSDILMGRGVRPIKVLFLQLMKPIDILFLSDAAVLLYIRLRLSSNCSEQFKPIPYTLNRGVWALIILTLLTMQIILTNNRFGGSKPLQLYQQSTSAYANVYGIIPLYSLEYFMLFHPQNFTIPKAVENPLEIENDLMGEELVKTGQNIICIQVESLDSNIIGYSYEGKEVTPFLNSLKEKALYFDNFYAQHVNGSFDAEFSFFTSIYPINKNYGFKVNDLTAFDSLVEKLIRKNYTTMAFHGNDKTFFSRDKAYDELGFHEFYSREDYDESSMRYSNEGSYLGINDYDFFQQSADYLDTAEEFFFAFFITVTSHTPFDFYPEELAVEEFEDIQNPLVKGYFNSAAFVDASLEAFFDKLERKGLIDDALIIIYADHDAGVEKDFYSSKREFILEKPVKVPENIPLFIIHPDIEPGISHKEGSPTDLAPTILDLLGEEEKPVEFVGHSMLSPVEAPVLFMHEMPQILKQGQLYVLTPDGPQRAGYDKETGKKSIDMPEEEEFLMMTDYMKGIILERRTETSP